jgi:hypothetical protein
MKTTTGDKSARDRRLVEALRDNLQRRKAQIRERVQDREAAVVVPERGDEARRDAKGD